MCFERKQEAKANTKDNIQQSAKTMNHNGEH